MHCIQRQTTHRPSGAFSTCFEIPDNDTRENPEICAIAPWNATFRDGEDKAGHYMIPIFWLRDASPAVISSTDLGVCFS